MAVGGSENITSEGGESEHKVSTEGASRFSARATCGKTAKGAHGGRKH